MADGDLLTFVLMFTAAALAVLIHQWRSGRNVGLLTTYVLSMVANYLLAPALMLSPAYGSRGFDLTVQGLRQCAFASLALAIGAAVATLIDAGPNLQADAAADTGMGAFVDRRLVRFYLFAGLFLYGVVLPIASRVSSLTALASAGSTLVIAAIGLQCWNLFQADRKGLFWLCLAATALLPAMTVLGQGFLGYGFVAMLTVCAFATSFYRPRWKILIAGIVLAYLGLSVYVTYMRDRGTIRAVVWGGAAMSARLDQIQETFGQFEWFDPSDADHVRRIEDRLNQDLLIGAAEQYIGGGSTSFADGATLVDACLAIIPRALWPGKPVVGGSGDIVSDYTGIHFADGTSVGVGHVLEAYINFGTMGVWGCFLVIGFALTMIDRRAYDLLARGDATTFVLWYLPGVGLLQVGGSFAETTSTAVAGLVMAWLLGQVARKTAPDRRRAPRLAAEAPSEPRS